MFTTIDKALVALIGSVLYFASTFLGVELTWLNDQVIQNIVAIATPILVYLVPNKSA